ncbi:sigma-70 family RNA polymerase sigma factor [Nocardia sp. NBC_00508]|uniref:sigma-70 family RNA polymerase sigma factor n=1 Tax=Nocardia sp. NBC_00508 TaxID=2975992 RepID=UPI002E821355|nr:sigma-70 family RNA polymerase sigma factor [Nocardia sp. NBC_00508]WUD67752.1 sigma-70 family RNA polymerase sigma factor [Nocardia sp. NBC_00508]
MADDMEFLARRFEQQRGQLRAMAYRMLGSAAEADDAVQEGWVRLSRSDAAEIDNLGGWLTTVVARVCLNMLSSRGTRREQPLDEHELVLGPEDAGPEQQAVIGDSVGLALLVVLDTLSPAERLSFVLHDMFAVPFDEIAPIVGKTSAAARQLASRARRRVQGARAVADRDRQREVVDAFLAASRSGDFQALLTLLDPDVVLRVDAAALASGAAGALGPDAVARTFSGRAKAARLALVDGRAGAVWAVGGTTRVVFDFTVTEGRIVAIDLVADAETLAQMQLEIPAK